MDEKDTALKERTSPKKVNISFMNLAHCACGKCPSFPGRVKELVHGDMITKLFCGQGAAKSEVEQKGCYCGRCQVYVDYGLTEGGETHQAYYCISGKSGGEAD